MRAIRRETEAEFAVDYVPKPMNDQQNIGHSDIDVAFDDAAAFCPPSLDQVLSSVTAGASAIELLYRAIVPRTEDFKQ